MNYYNTKDKLKEKFLSKIAGWDGLKEGKIEKFIKMKAMKIS